MCDALCGSQCNSVTFCPQVPHTDSFGLEYVDPNDQLKVKDKQLKDMGKDNFDLSTF
jgi:hypothetical protein